MFWIQDTGNKYNNSAYNLYYADEEADVKKLPTAEKTGIQEGDTVANKRTCAGSECLVLSTGNLYILRKNTDTWEVL